MAFSIDSWRGPRQTPQNPPPDETWRTEHSLGITVAEALATQIPSQVG